VEQNSVWLQDLIDAFLVWEIKVTFLPPDMLDQVRPMSLLDYLFGAGNIPGNSIKFACLGSFKKNIGWVNSIAAHM
jgi:hypothetical protein